MTYNKFEDYLQSIGSNPEIIFDPNPSPEKHKVYDIIMASFRRVYN